VRDVTASLLLCHQFDIKNIADHCELSLYVNFFFARAAAWASRYLCSTRYMCTTHPKTKHARPPREPGLARAALGLGITPTE
jgi:hypothetical protein